MTVIGGVPPYTYNWTENNVTVSNMEDLINFPSSQYDLEVTDAIGCTASTAVTISNPLALLFLAITNKQKPMGFNVP